MRYIIKGGVWKNSEDEILKAAVMKYGLNQWSRISSLLVRKSAKQCKQRWYEWLDPQIKKTEWTREEDEKLLHLAKIFPCQWRTIAPIVNRTPNQCIERYERLLDIAQGKDPDDPNDPRKLKPGEIDPNPETKPAKADPIDMDEDQKEMLAEARVRLANTMGKKPKRLAREKLIEDARRQAQLQKRTELKAAGIEMFGKKKQKGLNYNAEVPFERIVPEHVFQNPKEETPKPNLNFQNLSLRDIEGKMRIEEEENKRKIDEKRQKKLKENELDKVVEKMNKKTKEILSQHTKLVMPAPQLQDKDLEILGKMNNFQQLTNTDNEITKGLMGTYNQTDIPLTQIRTPRYQDQIINEAKNLIALNQTQTPLAGGQNPQLIEEKQVFSNSVNLQFKVPQTPNNLKKIIEEQRQMNQGFAIPASKKRTEQTQQQTPFRDQFGLNERTQIENQINNTYGWESSSQFSEDSQFPFRNPQQILKENMLNLPKPQNEYQFEIPDFDDEEDLEKSKKRVLDAEEEYKLKLREMELQKEKQIRQRSLAIQKKMPRPLVIPNQIYNHIYNKEDISDYKREAEQLLETETIQLLSFDNQNFPFPGCKPPNMKVFIEKFDEGYLNQASELISKEIQMIQQENNNDEIDMDKWNQFLLSYQYNPINDEQNIYSTIFLILFIKNQINKKILRCEQDIKKLT